ncbi:MAG: hypothetical protein U0401_08780 [Anaerolineae bacterium]
MTLHPSSFILGIDASRAARAHRTGTETYALELSKALAQLTSSSFGLRLYTPTRRSTPIGRTHLC